MDFFDAQIRARAKTRRLLALFAAAVAGVVALAYVAAVLLRALVMAVFAGESSPALWHPWLLVVVTAITCGLIGGASLWKWRQLRGDGWLVVKALGGRWISPAAPDLMERRLINIVEEMAVASGVPAPAVFVLEGENGMNAFAAGMTPRDAAIVVTRGALERLNRDELQGVIAHEFSHMLNGDARMNIVLLAVVHGLLFVAMTGEGIFKHWNVLDESPLFFLKMYAALVRVPVGLALAAYGFAGYLAGRLIVAMISRQREFLADAAAVQFTRNPAGIIGALRKIGLDGGAVAMDRAREFRHFFFSEACRSRLGGRFATHPHWLDRVRAINKNAARLIADDALEHGRLVVEVSDGETATAIVDRRKAARAQTTPSPAVARARELIGAIDPLLKSAAHDPERVQALVLGLLLDGDADARRAQWDLLTYESGAALKTIDELEPALLRLPAGHRLPLAQMALPALRMLPGLDAARFWKAADKLVMSDGRVTIFEYALSRMARRHLVSVAAAPVKKHNARADASPAAIGTDASVLLLALAHCDAEDEAAARRVFEAGKARLGPCAAFAKWRDAPVDPDSQDAPGQTRQIFFRRLDAALNRLSTAPLEARRSILAAAETAIASGGAQHVERMELFRMMGDTLGSPVPIVMQ